MDPLQTVSTNQIMVHQTEQYLEQKYQASLSGLKAALGLHDVALPPIPAHVLVCKAVALLRYQFSQMQKAESLRTRAYQKSKWDHQPKIRNTKTNTAVFHHDTRHFYGKQQKWNDHVCPPPPMMSADLNVATIGQNLPPAVGATNVNLPPIDWGSDSGFDTVDIERKLKTEMDQKQKIKSEDGSTTETNTQSREWADEIDFAVFDDDIDFDVPVQLDFESDFF